VRACEAGQGRADLVPDAQDLAARTSQATGVIGDQIKSIGIAADDADTAIADVHRSIDEISKSITEGAVAVPGQTHASQGTAANALSPAFPHGRRRKEYGSTLPGLLQNGTGSDRATHTSNSALRPL